MIEAAGEIEQAAALRRRPHTPQRYRGGSQAARIVKLRGQPDVHFAVDIDDRPQRCRRGFGKSRAHLEDVRVTKFEWLLAPRQSLGSSFESCRLVVGRQARQQSRGAEEAIQVVVGLRHLISPEWLVESED